MELIDSAENTPNHQITKSPILKVRILLEMIKFEHTIFALPFAYLGAFLAAGGPPDLWTSLWILVAMVGARTAAMGFNRIVDIPFDSKNPRTKERALPKGTVRARDAWIMVIVASGIYFLSAYELNRLAFLLSPVFLAVVLSYSYTKRFTSMCHLFLGLALSLAPMAGWIAVKGSVEFLPLILSTGVLFWVAGFDALYGCLDYDFDRKQGLHSIPARWGIKKAFWISGLFHLVAFIAFISVGFQAHLNWIYYSGLLATFALLVMQRLVVNPSDLSRMNMAFFTFNGAISIILFTATAISLIWKV
ncbi:MAG: putative 4-hydroxybenzoate polyprenyltransferase [Deltaproteobacteria bacterium]|nr:putative 4-hydroxybenzoate polyprenyltransferase [Deltaproteobacteria bacterium]MDL1961713.1 putative 4-hydroxybenzoate polyprenyltransferase [Deltaproteobacteria bacterium]